MEFRVELEMCVEGDPHKAWHGTTGEDDTEHVPDDVWESKTFSFGGDLDAAKAWVRDLPAASTTHVKVFADDELIFDQDAGADHLDDAAPGVQMPHTVDFGGFAAQVQPEPAPLAVPPPSDIATEVG